MTSDILIAFAAYAFVTSITPGPNNTMLLASGVNFGFSRTIPHILGISLGFAAMVVAVGAGLGLLFVQWPVLHTALRWIGAAYLLWLAWKIASASSLDGSSSSARPMTFLQAAAFQWVNPKCWIMAIGAIATYLPTGSGAWGLVFIAILYALINGPSVAVWAGFGVLIRRWLSTPRILQVFNITMALLLVLSLYPLIH